MSVDRRDNDPAVLTCYLAAIFDRVEPIDLGIFCRLASPDARPAWSRVDRRTSSMSGLEGVVPDNLEPLVNQECVDAVAETALRLPKGSQ